MAVKAETPVSFMLLAGEPIREPIAHYGPFVMNTREEIEQVVLDYQEGRMGYLEWASGASWFPGHSFRDMTRGGALEAVNGAGPWKGGHR